jgi:MscS family membrane protein
MFETWQDFREAMLESTIAQNSLWQIGGFVLLLIGFYLAAKLLQLLLILGSKRAAGDGAEVRSSFLGHLGRSITFVLFVAGLFAGEVFFLEFGEARAFLLTIFEILMAIAVGLLVYRLTGIPRMVLEKRAKRTGSALDDMLPPIVGRCLQVTVVVLVIIQIGSIVSGKGIGAIVAGLGIGGLAVALAAQDTLKNFFGTLTLMADKPFSIGERVNIDGHDGPVESVGLRSTRVRTLDGHLVTFPNGELANRAIWNIGKRPHIRRLFHITVTYDTPPAKVEEGKQILESILENHEGVREDFPPRVHFSSFNDASLGYQVIYWYHPADYWAYMAFSERVNMEILKRFNEASIEFAFPTQTLYLAGDPNRPLKWGEEG